MGDPSSKQSQRTELRVLTGVRTVPVHADSWNFGRFTRRFLDWIAWTPSGVPRSPHSFPQRSNSKFTYKRDRLNSLSAAFTNLHTQAIKLCLQMCAPSLCFISSHSVAFTNWHTKAIKPCLQLCASSLCFISSVSSNLCSGL